MSRTGCVICSLALLLAGCGDRHPTGDRVLATVRPGPVEFSLQAEGELRAVASTPLQVPGQQWALRQLAWVLPDGSRAAKGELVARFSADQSRQDLAEARIDLQRNLLAKAGKRDELQVKRDQLGVDLVQVDGQLAIARRYAHATQAGVARNDVLDAVQDMHYLGVRRGILDWREAQSAVRGKAELAVLDAQHDSYAGVVRQKQADLDALELRAPHAGVLMLERNWAGELPHVGSNLFAGQSFGNLPDLDALEVQLAIPQVQAQGLAVGQAVELHPWGRPAQTVRSTLRWIAATAQPRDQQDPVKYVQMKAAVPVAAVRHYGWSPGQRFVGRVVLLQVAHGVSVPNLALHGSADERHAEVEVIEHGRPVPRRVTLGVRGAVRSQVLDGLHAGERIVLDGSDTGAGA